tara:strand:+ start:221 stop:448 length:228 start_codon:yes stop_codon:yes gene_type:complete
MAQKKNRGCPSGTVYNTSLKKCVAKPRKPMTDKEAAIWGKYISKRDLAPQIYDFSKREIEILDSLKLDKQLRIKQ